MGRDPKQKGHVSTIECVACGHGLPSNAKYCSQCGARTKRDALTEDLSITRRRESARSYVFSVNRDCAKHFDSLEVEEDLEELLGDSLIEEMDIKKNEIWMKWLRQPRREWLDKVQVYLRDSFADL